MNVFTEFEAIVHRLQGENFRYALVGGVAMAFYAAPRFTQDIDLLIPAGEFDRLKTLLTALGYFESATPWTFASTAMSLHRFMRIEGPDSMLIDVLLAGSDRHLAIVEQAVEARNDRGDVVRVATRDDLIWMKSLRNSKQDQADIERLHREEP